MPNGRTFFFVDPAIRLCYGFVGQGGKRFCLKSVKDESGGIHTCGVAKHSNKFNPSNDMFYLKGNETSAFCSPAFPTILVPEDYKGEIRSLKKAAEEWKQLFKEWSNQVSATSNQDDVENGVAFDNDIKIELKTPCKRISSSMVTSNRAPLPIELENIMVQAQLLPVEQHWCEDNLDPQLDQGNEEVIRVALLTFDLKR